MRSWAGAWRRRPTGAPDESRRNGVRIAVLGNCQAEGIVEALRLLLPNARVDLVAMASLARDHGTVARLASHLDGFDHVFSQFFPEGFVTGGNVHALAEGNPRMRLFPTVLFPGFHPDMVHVGDVDGLSASRLVPSPVGPYHSAIVLCAHLEGLRPDATAALFRDAVFERLGYYEAWTEAANYLLGSARDLAFPLDNEFARWSRRGCFMHVLNHPRLFVLGDLARRLATEAGLAPLAVEVETYLPDDLVADAVWPVYPDLADRYGLPGSLLFKGRGRAGTFPPLYDLPAFIAESFAIYARHRPEELACGRVATWRADDEVRALFSTDPR